MEKELLEKLKGNPTLASDPAFMKSLIDENVNYIAYDHTNDIEVYKYCLNKLVSENQLDKEYAKQKVDAIIREIDNPKQVEDGKYKIPKEFLMEGIRKSAIAQSDLLSPVSSYLRYDGTIPSKLGNELESIYKDPNNYTLMHVINSSFWMMPKEDIENIRDKVFATGLRCSTQDEYCLNSLSRTTNGSHQETFDFFQLLNLRNAIIIKIPKECIDGKQPVWGSHSPEVTKTSPGFILPEYIVGYIDPETQEFIVNPVKEEDRETYAYLFAEQELVGTENLKKKV